MAKTPNTKKNALISVTHNADDNALMFTVGEAGSFVLPIGELSNELRSRALVHGLVQKVSDAAAMPKAELTGDPKKDAAAKLANMTAVRDRLMSGDWSRRAGDGSGPVAGLIFRAFSEFAENAAKKAKKPVPDADKLRAFYDGKTRAEQLALRNIPEVSTIIERMKAERGADAKPVDTGALLGELGI